MSLCCFFIISDVLHTTSEPDISSSLSLFPQKESFCSRIPRDSELNENVFCRRHSSRYANNINAPQPWSRKAFPAAGLKRKPRAFRFLLTIESLMGRSSPRPQMPLSLSYFYLRSSNTSKELSCLVDTGAAPGRGARESPDRLTISSER